MKLQLHFLSLLLLLTEIFAFTIFSPRSSSVLRLFSTDQDQQADNNDGIGSMRVREIQVELKERGVSYTDCFDRESLAMRLKEARSMPDRPTPPSVEVQQQQQQSASTTATTTKSNKASSDSPADRESIIQELRAMRVAELRSECGQRNIRWGNMLEKEDLVQALLKARLAAGHFSSTPSLVPGQVGSLTGDELEQELSPNSISDAPLLLDVYATWCGPCQLMAPQLVEAAAELGDKVRIAKIDSDQFPDWSRKLKVQAFPTVIMFDTNGKEVKRVEGALMKNQILNLVEPYLS